MNYSLFEWNKQQRVLWAMDCDCTFDLRNAKQICVYGLKTKLIANRDAVIDPIEYPAYGDWVAKFEPIYSKHRFWLFNGRLVGEGPDGKPWAVVFFIV